MKENELKRAIDSIEISDSARERILSGLISSNAKKERKIMKIKVIAVAAAAALVLGASGFAASNIIVSCVGHSSAIPTYTSLPTAERCVKDVGYAPKLIESFENGYTFKDGTIVHNALKDENNLSVEEFKSITFHYEKDGDKVNFAQEKFSSEMEGGGDVIATADGIDIRYTGYTNKLVPPDYKLTEEDERAKESGELVFSYGSDEVEIIEVKCVAWTDGEIRSSLLQLDGKLSSQELADMAAEVIAAK